MNNPQKATRRGIPPVIPQGEVVADFATHAEASTYVDLLVKNDFPPQAIAIIGSDLRTVERLRGKLTYARVALGGAATGSWIGLLYGLLFGAQPTAATVEAATVAEAGSIVSAVVVGAGIGMLVNVLRFSMARNRRQYLSASSVIANRYDVIVPANLIDQAREAAAKTN